MIREVAHNATALKGDKPALKPPQGRDIAGFARCDERYEAISRE